MGRNLRFKVLVLISTLLALLILGITAPAVPVYSQNTVTASDLINLINGMRTSNGLGALAVDSSLMASAQNTASTMAINNMSWHIGDVSGRVSAFGYNNGNKAFATENFATGPATLASIQSTWGDYDHMIPATNPAYCHIGAGVAEANGRVYYVVQAAYPANSKGCGFLPGVPGTTGASGSTVQRIDMSQIIASIKIATPNPEGQVIHVVQNGQSLWSIASAYKVPLEDIAAWNNIIDIASLQLDQKLLIPEPGTGGSVPTRTTMPTILPTQDEQGRYIHVIKEGDTLSSIASLWTTTIQELERWNGIDETTTLSLGWRLIIPVTPTNTVPPTFTPLPSLTPSITPTLAEITETPVPFITQAPVNRRHLPEVSARTFIFGGGGVLVILFGLILGARYIYRRGNSPNKKTPLKQSKNEPKSKNQIKKKE